VEVTAEGRRQTLEVRCGDSFLSGSSRALHFGLGASKRADIVAVRWPGGQLDEYKDVTVDQVVTVVEGGSLSGQGRGGAAAAPLASREAPGQR
jgi:hypothetical protein